MSNKTRLFHFAVALVGAGLLGSPAGAVPGDIYNLGTLNPGDTSSHGWDINGSGQVAGYSVTPGNVSRAFRYSGTPGSGGAMADLGTLPGGNASSGFGINDAGQVAGTSNVPFMTGSIFRAFRYTGTPGSGGAMADLGTLGGHSHGRSINAAGQVAGESEVGASSNYHAFRTGPNGAINPLTDDLGTLGGSQSFVFGINDAGQVTGHAYTTGNTAWHAFRYSGTPGSGGAMADLGTLGGALSDGLAINNAGQVAGYSRINTTSATQHAFRYTGTPGAGGAMVDLGTLGGAGSTASGINDAGFVVGSAERSAGAGGAYAATLWQTDAANTAIDLDAWLDANNPTLGAYWTLGIPTDINNNGLISGTGTYNDGPGGLTDGTRAYILDASSLVPEPGGLSLLAAGGFALLHRRRAPGN